MLPSSLRSVDHPPFLPKLPVPHFSLAISYFALTPFFSIFSAFHLSFFAAVVVNPARIPIPFLFCTPHKMIRSCKFDPAFANQSWSRKLGSPPLSSWFPLIHIFSLSKEVNNSPRISFCKSPPPLAVAMFSVFCSPKIFRDTPVTFIF